MYDVVDPHPNLLPLHCLVRLREPGKSMGLLASINTVHGSDDVFQKHSVRGEVVSSRGPGSDLGGICVSSGNIQVAHQGNWKSEILFDLDVLQKDTEES